MILAGRKRIGIVHPRMCGLGGSELRPAWIAQALKDDYAVTFITMGSLDLDVLNSYTGTHLDRSEIEVITIPIPRFLSRHFAALRGYTLAKLCLNNAGAYDLMISTYNVMDFGKKGIQFIADLSFSDVLRRRYHPAYLGKSSLLYRASPPRWLYIKLSERLNSLSGMRWMRNITIANSEWTRCILHEFYGLNATVVYPPVPEVPPGKAWKERENGFVFLGRISPEKRLEETVRILQGVRQAGENIHFHLLGPIEETPYGRRIKNIILENRDWLSWEGVVIGEQKHGYLGTHRYGISGRRAEPFGISLAEQAKAGCLVWAPNGGGQVEIVGHPILTYKSVEDAVQKILKVMRSESLTEELRQHLSLRVRMFSTKSFMEQVRYQVGNYFHCK
jgi:glycosyltransferase involved in cell wall biosynthesis